MLRALVVGLGLVAFSGTAFALDEGQWQVGIAPQLTAGFDDRISMGGGGRVDGRYGITDALSGWAAVGALWIPQNSYTARSVSASAGLMLAYDVVRIVPFVGLGVAGAEINREARLGGELNAGADYLLDRSWSLGLQANLQILGPPGENLVGTLALGLRLARTF